MSCPQCGAWSSVKETRKDDSGTVKRRRECGNRRRLTTFEVTETEFKAVAEIRSKAQQEAQ